MGFGEAFRRCFSDSVQFCVALPLVFAVLVAAEAVQHIAEWSIFFYVSVDAFKQHANDAQRMAPGLFKVFLSYVVLYWIARWAASGRNVGAAWRADPVAIRRFAVAVAFFTAFGLFQLEGASVLHAAGLDLKTARLVVLIILLVTFPLSFRLLPWFTGSALGGEPIGPLESGLLARGSLLWTLGLTFAVALPLMVPHYILGYAAVGKPMAVLVPMLALDTLVAGFLIVVINQSIVLSTQRMLRRNGRTLQCDGGTFV